jgi:hypothetical protein
MFIALYDTVNATLKECISLSNSKERPHNRNRFDNERVMVFLPTREETRESESLISRESRESRNVVWEYVVSDVEARARMQAILRLIAPPEKAAVPYLI